MKTNHTKIKVLRTFKLTCSSFFLSRHLQQRDPAARGGGLCRVPWRSLLRHAGPFGTCGTVPWYVSIQHTVELR